MAGITAAEIPMSTIISACAVTRARAALSRFTCSSQVLGTPSSAITALSDRNCRSSERSMVGQEPMLSWLFAEIHQPAPAHLLACLSRIKSHSAGKL
eukprot:1012150-Pelagomonas_calceolata.AAC.7